ncbi:MAG: diaminopimelate epimerase [Lachnospiraceae bacterium]|nr:diaminopimelate epimerase [Lachnospiraceae bacterium]
MTFTKMEGCGNDYVYINGAAVPVDKEIKPDLVRKLSDRHFGIGSDGVIFINPSEKADFEMEMWNADGTRAEMCGNGIRCVAKYVYDKSLTQKTELKIESFGKVKDITIIPEDGKAKLIRVNMGSPILESSQIPVVSGSEKVIDELICTDAGDFNMTCVSMGNPHAVIFEDPDVIDIEKAGSAVENHPRFPKRTNTEFVKIIDRANVRMRVWERGTGETLACGTGCCATAVACVLNGLTDDKVTVHVLGGRIEVFWDRDNDTVYMTGPAKTVFEGEIDYDQDQQ